MNILFSISGFIVASVGFVLLFLLFLTVRKNSLQRTLLLSSSLLSALWAASSALQIHYNYSIFQHLSTETLRNSGWFLLIVTALRPNKNLITIVQSSPIILSIAVLLLINLFLELGYPHLNWLMPNHILSFHLAQSVIGLWLIEQLFRSTDKSARWTIKPICLGLGTVFAYDFALYADGVLTNMLSREFVLARGWVVIISVPLIMLTARRITQWSTRIYVSRDIVYHSTLLSVAGSYLLVMALAGYYIKYAGGDWGAMIQNVFFALSGLVLASLFLSEPLRRKLKVFIAKHFYANKYEYRQEWMRFSSTLEEEADSPYKIALLAFIRPFECESAMIASLIHNNLKSQASLNIDEKDQAILGVATILAREAIKHNWIIDLTELKDDTSKLPFDLEIDDEVLSNFNAFNYIIPISNPSGSHNVCFLSEPKSTHSINWEDRDLMWAISKQLSVYLNLHQSNQIIAENQQFDTFNRMSAFLAHDLKNVLSQLQLLSRNAKKHRDNPEFIEDAFATIDSASERLEKVVNHLKKKNTDEKKEQSFDVDSIIEQVCHQRAIDNPKPKFQGGLMQTSITADKNRFSNIISHLIQNAQDATEASGSVTVTSSFNDDYNLIRIKDDGAGMTEEFVERRLFKPFDTTKGNSGMGIGAYDAKRFIEQLGGYVEVFSTVDKGTQFEIKIPRNSQ
ncbi:XrtA/PEP-CTERM system histidine kinase PrsK [Vibrio sp. HN007]|uniref:XrtA/PEP-CTERM system histidine kinase PrsK n=1 Tax=Vibrio iocasae TaxID=3098914 RepID=UPI0035D3E804